MKRVSLIQAEQLLIIYMNLVKHTHQPILIEDGSNSAILLNKADYEELSQNAH